MIYLIGGSARSGKSKLSKILGKRLDCQYISVDDIRPAILPYIPKNEIAEKFPFETMYENFDNNDAYFEKYSAQEMLKAEIQDAKSLWPAVKAFIIHKYLCNQDFVIESIPLLPEILDELKSHEVWQKIKVVYVVKTDVKKIREGLELNDPKSDWLLRNTKNPETFDKAAEMVSEYGKYISKEAEKYGFKVFNTEEDFASKLEEAADYLIKSESQS